MGSCVKFRLAARTEAAGKYDPSAPQEGNEDNYGVIADIADLDHRPAFDEETQMSDMGVLMFVSDGMGGHNAGEVASKIAVDTVYEAFGTGKVSPGIAASHEARAIYMEGVIKEADKRIRSHASHHAECEGMGATLVIAWLTGGEMTVSWCGDSRCYLFRSTPEPRIAMVSEDHSYVQELVQRGVIPYEATFGHPRGNIITRCLGGGGSSAVPESRLAKVGCGDIVLLCSDGLSGVLFDDGRLFDGQPISNENICDILAAEATSLRASLQSLFSAAQRAEWYDNVTAILCQLTEGGAEDAAWPPVMSSEPVITSGRKRWKTWVVWLSVCVIAILMCGTYLIVNQFGDQNDKHSSVVPILNDYKVDVKAQKMFVSGTADEYRLKLYEYNDEGDTVLHFEKSQTDTCFLLPEIDSQKAYLFRVQAIRGSESTPWRGKRLSAQSMVPPTARVEDNTAK